MRCNYTLLIHNNTRSGTIIQDNTTINGLTGRHLSLESLKPMIHNSSPALKLNSIKEEGRQGEEERR